MNPHYHYQETISSFGSKTIMVIGDLFLDVYLRGKSTRICPDAPAPVVDVDERTVALGGAANTACNLRALGARVIFFTVMGNDTEGNEAFECLRSAGIDTNGVIRSRNRKTITKTRVVSGSQIVARIDHGSDEDVNIDTATRLAASIEKSYHKCDAIVISDYGKGILTPPLIDKLAMLRASHDIFTAVDSKRLTYFSSLHPSCAKPNYYESLQLLQLKPEKDRVYHIARHSEELHEKINAAVILATLDEDGSLVIENGQATHHIPASSSAKRSVSGAGDTFASAFVLSWLNSNNTRVSAEIASAAASIAIDKDCTAVCTQAELRTFFTIHSKYVGTIEHLEELCSAYHRAGRKVVFTNGCFDILHSGHVTYLDKAKRAGDILIVGLNSDESISRIKGNNRPINALEDRIQVLAGLSSVDHIIAFGDVGDDTPVPLIRAVRPDVFVKGGDYTRETLPEAKTVEAYGGKILLIDHIPDHSTTRIISRIRSSSADLDPAFSKLPS